MLVCVCITGNARAASQFEQVSACRRESFADYDGEILSARAFVVSCVEGRGELPVSSRFSLNVKLRLWSSLLWVSTLNTQRLKDLTTSRPSLVLDKREAVKR